MRTVISGPVQPASGPTPAFGYPLSAQQLAAYDELGVLCLRQVLDESWIDRMRRATDALLAAPTEFMLDSNPTRASGRFVRDRFLSHVNADFAEFSAGSPLVGIAAQVMRSQRVFLLSDLIFVKEPHTADPTPWHHDKPYGWFDGQQACQFWVALDRVDRTSGTMEFVCGSHRWGKLFNMRDFGLQQGYESDEFEPVPDIDAERDRHRLAHFDMEPGDCVMFSELILHAAPGNGSDRRRRAIAVHYAGDDAVFVRRRHSRLPFADPGVKPGEPFGCALFPQVWPPTSPRKTPEPER